MAGKAKFDQEAAFKSIIRPGRESGSAAPKKAETKEKIETGCSGHIFWIGI